jgi:hypothetical protein
MSTSFFLLEGKNLTPVSEETLHGATLMIFVDTGKLAVGSIYYAFLEIVLFFPLFLSSIPS